MVLFQTFTSFTLRVVSISLSPLCLKNVDIFGQTVYKFICLPLHIYFSLFTFVDWNKDKNHIEYINS